MDETAMDKGQAWRHSTPMVQTLAGAGGRAACLAYYEARAEQVDEKLREIVAKHGSSTARGAVVFLLDGADARGAEAASRIVTRFKAKPLSPERREMICGLAVGAACDVFNAFGLDVYAMGCVPDDSAAIVAMHAGCVLLGFRKVQP